MQVRPTTDSGFSSSPTLPTTRAQHGEDRNNKIYARDASKPQNLENALATLPTPKAQDGYKGNKQTSAERRAKGFFIDLPNVAIDLISIPTVRDFKDGSADRVRDGEIQTDTVARAIISGGEVNYLPTPQVDDSKNTGHNQDRRPTLASEVWNAEHTTTWGKFEPAIRRWEQILGRPAPAPTKPDGKDGSHRLSSEFTEWMMGVPAGWITDCGLSRNDELKACGNGVVPQQAELALRFLLEGVEFERGGATGEPANTNRL